MFEMCKRACGASLIENMAQKHAQQRFTHNYDYDDSFAQARTRAYACTRAVNNKVAECWISERETDSEVKGIVLLETIDIEVACLRSVVRQVESSRPVETKNEEA